MFKLIQAKLEAWAEKELVEAGAPGTWRTPYCGYVEDMDGTIRKIDLDDFDEPEQRAQPQFAFIAQPA